MQVLTPPVQHYRRPVTRPFTKAERPYTTILFGGLTYTHDYLLEGALKGLGYLAKHLPVPDNESLFAGKEYGNRGQCNPTYYTVGNLIKYLKYLRECGVENIEDKYVFLTAGSCGPCRFGMYEAEYKKALQEAGFPGFRVLLFQQKDEFNQREESGIELTPKFFVTLLKTIMAADMINELGYKIRPYEMIVGKTDKCIAEARDILYRTLTNKRPLFRALKRVRKIFSSIQVDYSRIKPKVKITGEFHRWLESEGAEVIAEPVSTWAEYVFWEHSLKAKDRIGIKKGAVSSLIFLSAIRFLFKACYNSYRFFLNFRPNPLPSQTRMAEYARDYYNARISGGESHMEVGKHIMSFREKKAHLVISVKPFGCMPSTQSDGVQAKVITDLRDSLFLPVETSGDGEVNVKSRIQMKLYEAKERARQEVSELLTTHGLTMKQVEEFSKANPCHGMLTLPHHVVTTAGNFIHARVRKLKSASGRS